MGPRLKTCCVPGCNNRDAKRHTITKKKYQNVWLQRINNEKLLSLDDKELDSCRICDIHFDNVCKESSGKLRNGSLPTLHLPGYEKVENDNFLSPSPKIEKLTPVKIRESLKLMEASTSKTTESSPIGSVIMPRKVYSRKRLFVDEIDRGTDNEEHNSGKKITFEGPSTSNVVVSKVRGRCTSFSRSHSEKALLRQVSRYKWAAKQARKNNLATKAKLKFLQKNPLQVDFKDINVTTLRFFQSQLKNQQLKSKGRRFSLDDKVFALSIFKQSGKGYRFLSKIFSLPSRKTLTKLLNDIPFNCGINTHLFDHLKIAVEKMKPLDKWCVLMFDEISLSTGLSYNSKRDCVEGLVDLGQDNRKALFADHALVFMVKGIHRSWKQPIAFYFCEHTTSTVDLVRLVKEVTKSVQETGLKIIASICDQGATNNAAIRQLINDTKTYCARNNIENRFQGYLIDNDEIIHLFDGPHLLKGIRNGLLTKNLHFKQSGHEKVASWSHVMDIYRMDKDMGKFSQFPKLTDHHILPQKIKKMKVKNCSQVFSRTVATAMKIRAEISKELPSNSQFFLDPSATQTADLLLFFDEIFDSINGMLINPPLGKELRGVVNTKSIHVQFWNNSLPILQSMFFASEGSAQHIITPSIRNWVFTIRGFIYLWRILKDKGFKFISTRSFNQDPLENFFGLVRSHGVRNTNPTCTSFISSTKTLLINNFLSSHSPGSNCEEDVSIGALSNLKEFVKRNERENEGTSYNISAPIYANSTASGTHQSLDSLDITTPYVAGVIAKKLLKKNKCRRCSELILTKENLPQNILIKKREFKEGSLSAPSEKFTEVFNSMSQIMYKTYPTIINQLDIKKTIIDKINPQLISPLFCENHKCCTRTLIDYIFNMTIFHYLKIINQILNGKDQRHKNVDALCTLAYDKFAKK